MATGFKNKLYQTLLSRIFANSGTPVNQQTMDMQSLPKPAQRQVSMLENAMAVSGGMRNTEARNYLNEMAQRIMIPPELQPSVVEAMQFSERPEALETRGEMKAQERVSGGLADNLTSPDLAQRLLNSRHQREDDVRLDEYIFDRGILAMGNQHAERMQEDAQAHDKEMLKAKADFDSDLATAIEKDPAKDSFYNAAGKTVSDKLFTGEAEAATALNNRIDKVLANPYLDVFFNQTGKGLRNFTSYFDDLMAWASEPEYADFLQDVRQLHSALAINESGKITGVLSDFEMIQLLRAVGNISGNISPEKFRELLKSVQSSNTRRLKDYNAFMTDIDARIPPYLQSYRP